jgi:hypothetical protein
MPPALTAAIMMPIYGAFLLVLENGHAHALFAGGTFAYVLYGTYTLIPARGL